jgi:hypothetical protein
MSEFIFFEESWNGNWEREVYQRRTRTTSETSDDTEDSRGYEQVLKKD